jgi:hypothetical protein
MLNNALHVPSTHKSLISVHRFTLDNDTFIEFLPYFFLIKDQKISVDRWHSRLGHPSHDIVHRVISKNKLSCAHFDSPSESVCDACACAKAHQLPYHVSYSRSSTPLELVFSDVWGPTINSFGRKKYYVSFIDDYSKFTSIYLLHHKSDVSKYFLEFQTLVECMLDKKIIVVQSDWGGEYENLNSFFKSVGISNLMSCPHTRQQNGDVERNEGPDKATRGGVNGSQLKFSMRT